MARWTRPALLTGLALLAASSAAVARRLEPQQLPAVTVADLPYGDVLFYFFQGRDFEAAARLMAYQQLHELPHHEADGQLLLGGLYLSLGMSQQAGRRFEALLRSDVPVGVRNRAWFYLARVHYAGGDFPGAGQALGRIQGRLSEGLEPQRQLLAAEVLMHEGHFARAARQLSGWSSTEQGWTAYAKLNLGVALARAGRLAAAAPYLNSVGTMYALAPEMLALRDRANLALGVAYLKARQPAAAQAALDRVRLRGPFSNEALLASGWADASAGDYRAALTPWLTLSGRNPFDANVQEAHLTVPYAFVRLKAQAQAVRYYRSAVGSWGIAEAQIDRAVRRIRGGSLIAQLLAHSGSVRNAALGGNDLLNESALPDQMRYSWYWHLGGLPDSAESQYLYAAFAGHAFQEGLRNYRDLELMDRMLAQWSGSMAAFQDMIAARRRAYAERLPAVDTMLGSHALAQLAQRQAALTTLLAAVGRTHDVVALASQPQRAQWARVEHLQSALAAAPATPLFASMRERLRLVRGVLLYRMSEQFPRRLWRAHRQLSGIDLELTETAGRWIRLEAERRSVPAGTGGFAARVTALKQRLRTLQARVAAARRAQAAELAQVAVERLERQRRQLELYRTQAQFALATIYDQAAHRAAPGPARPARATPPADPSP